MRASTWQRIYQRLEDRQDHVARQWGVNISCESPGIDVMNDELARQWQRLEHIKARVWVHCWRAWNRESRAVCRRKGK